MLPQDAETKCFGANAKNSHLNKCSSNHQKYAGQCNSDVNMVEEQGVFNVA